MIRTLTNESLTYAPLLLLTGTGYAVATFGIKLVSRGPTFWGAGLLLGGLILAVSAELILLRRAQLSVIYLSAIAVETLLVLSVALIFGDKLSAAQLAGALLILTGTLMVSH